MQLLGKNYFEDGEMTADTTQETALAEDGVSEEGLEQLCETVGRPRPAWMSAAAGMVRENKRHLTVAASVLIIGFAIYLNWTMADGNTDLISDGYDLSQSAAVGDVLDAAGMTSTDAALADTASGDDYFAVSQINRQRARDEAIAVLQDVVDGAANLSDVQSDALAQITQIAADIEREAAIESLVRGKGFADCVAVISGENVNVIVRSSSLLPNEIAQIQEIVFETAGILPANVKIIEK